MPWGSLAGGDDGPSRSPFFLLRPGRPVVVFFEARADRMISYFLYSTFLYARPLKSICGHLIAADGWMDLGRIMLFDFQPSPQLRVGFRPTTPWVRWPRGQRAPSPRTCSLTKVVRVKIYRTKRRSESHISRNTLLETRPLEIHEIRIRISGQTKTKMLLFYSFIYISYYLFSSQK